MKIGKRYFLKSTISLGSLHIGTSEQAQHAVQRAVREGFIVQGMRDRLVAGRIAAMKDKLDTALTDAVMTESGSV